MVPLFAAVLRGLGYDFYFTGARISSAMAGDAKDGPGYHGWSHLVLIVTISGQKYVVDPQYIEITEPVLLDPQGKAITFDGIPTTTVRLRYCALSEIIPHRASNSGLMTWLFELKRSSKDTWTPEYTFSTETEWFLEDLPIMNVWLARAEESYMVTKFIIKRMVLADEGDLKSRNSTGPGSRPSEKHGLLTVPAISGSVELAHDTLTVFEYGKNAINEKIETEMERLDIVKKWFGIALTEEEAKAVLSRPTSLRY
jgi:arylamine N-acetyltransferase